MRFLGILFMAGCPAVHLSSKVPGSLVKGTTLSLPLYVSRHLCCAVDVSRPVHMVPQVVIDETISWKGPGCRQQLLYTETIVPKHARNNKVVSDTIHGSMARVQVHSVRLVPRSLHSTYTTKPQTPGMQKTETIISNRGVCDLWPAAACRGGTAEQYCTGAWCCPAGYCIYC